MSNKLRINSLIVFVLALLFAFFFDFTKHNPSLSPINPFADDPYDAIGSFAFQATIFFGLLSLFRAFRPYRKDQPSDEQKLFLVRTQIAIVLSILVTLVGDLVAMIRHFPVWSRVSAGYLLLALVIAFSILSIAIGIIVRNSARNTFVPVVMNSLKRSAIISSVFFIVLLFYPESIRKSTLGALFTVVVGAVLLFMPVWAWGEFLTQTMETPSKTITSRWIWIVVSLMGILLGFAIVLRELTAEGETISLAGSIFIISVYIGLEFAGVVIGYSFLGKFLGIFQKRLVK